MRNLASAVGTIAMVLVVACGDDGGSSLPDSANAVDAADPCDECGAGELCIQRFDGTCTMGTFCTATTLECPPNTCSPACEEAFCYAPYQCENRSPCGTESARSFKCYGP